jgi:hypothetical protein
MLNLRETNTDSSKDFHAGLIVAENLKPSGPLNGNYHAETGIESELTTDAADTQNHGDLYGIESIVSTHGSGSVDNQYAFSAGNQVIGGPVGSLHGLAIFVSPVAAAISNNYGIDIETPNITTGSIGTNYGLTIKNQNVGTNNYAIWYDAGQCGVAREGRRRGCRLQSIVFAEIQPGSDGLRACRHTMEQQCRADRDGK